jgi:hypothetical protein
LLEGQPDVLDLLADNPFPDGPPEFIRSTLWSYTFTTPEQRDATGNIWNHEQTGEYCPTVTLRNGQLVVIDR